MKMAKGTSLVVFLLGVVLAGRGLYGNGGPFAVKYPNGDPAAKGVLARLDPSLKPGRESRLRVVKEDLTVRFVGHPNQAVALPPRVEVTADYTIENPTPEEIQVDFGFPILRGIYVRRGMVAIPDVRVTADGKNTSPTVLSNSVIYGMIRANARAVTEKGIEADKELAGRTAAVRAAWTKPTAPATRPEDRDQDSLPADIQKKRIPTADYLPARERLRSYLKDTLHWNSRDTELLIEYVGLDLGPRWGYCHDSWDRGVSWSRFSRDSKAQEDIPAANLGPLEAIGEQKATQLFAQLALQFDKEAGTRYEAIFTAWGGDVRERSLDLDTGAIRPREVTVPAPKTYAAMTAGKLPAEYYDQRVTADPTVYARVDYLVPDAWITAEEKASCEAILKNLPVVFTFAPMNLLHYQVTFASQSTRHVVVKYSQYAYADTRGTGSYQLAYVLHPATLWNDFGPIHLTVHAPKDITCKASVPLVERPVAAMAEAQQRVPLAQTNAPPEPPMAVYTADLQDPREKQGELFIVVDQAAWDKTFPLKKTISP